MKTTLCSSIAALAALLSQVSPAAAGMLTITSGPNFTPDTAFTNNTINVNQVIMAV